MGQVQSTFLPTLGHVCAWGLPDTHPLNAVEQSRREPLEGSVGEEPLEGSVGAGLKPQALSGPKEWLLLLCPFFPMVGREDSITLNPGKRGSCSEPCILEALLWPGTFFREGLLPWTPPS